MQIDTYISFHRGGVAVKSTPAPPEPEEDREKFQEVTPKTYKVLQKELPQAEATGGGHFNIFINIKEISTQRFGKSSWVFLVVFLLSPRRGGVVLKVRNTSSLNI